MHEHGQYDTRECYNAVNNLETVGDLSADKVRRVVTHAGGFFVALDIRAKKDPDRRRRKPISLSF